MSEAGENAESRATWERRGEDPGPATARKPPGLGARLMRQFRELAGILTHAHDARQPITRRRRSGETRGGFMSAARKLFHHSSRIPPAAYAKPALLWNTLDWLNPWHTESIVTAHESDAAYKDVQSQQNLYPHL